MNIKEYLEEIKAISLLNEKITQHKKSITKLVNEENFKIGEQLSDIFLKTFNYNDFIIPKYNRVGSYDEKLQLISYKFNLSDSFINMCKNSYGSLVSRRGKSLFIVVVNYYIVENKFVVSIDNWGFGSTSIKDPILEDSIAEMFWDVRDITSKQKINIDEIQPILQKIKAIVDNYDSYYVTNKLENM